MKRPMRCLQAPNIDSYAGVSDLFACNEKSE